MNKDEHKDYSIWCDFLENQGVFMSNAVLSQAAIDIAVELESRGRTKDETNDVINKLGDAKRANFMRTSREIAEEMAEILGRDVDVLEQMIEENGEQNETK